MKHCNLELPSGFPDGFFLIFMKTLLTFTFFLAFAFHFLSGRNLNVSLDILQYRGTDSLTECRLVYSLPDTALRYIPSLEGYVGSVHMKVKFVNIATKDSIIDEWIIDNISQNPVVMHERNLIGGRSVYVIPGNYSISIQAIDIHDSSAVSSVRLSLPIRAMSMKTMHMSDLMTTFQIEQLNDSTKLLWSHQFQRNGLLLIPNPSLECIGTDPILHLYSELYECLPGDSLNIQYVIKDAAQRVLAEIPIQKFVHAEAIVETVALPLLGLPSGVYTVHMKYHGIKKQDTVSGMKRFYIVNPEMPPELANTFSEDELFQQSEFSTYSENRINEEFEKAKCLSNSQEQSLWSALGDVTAKQKFMYRFWKERDPNTDTPINEKLEEFRKSISYANTYFANPQFKEGWRSDRGRVLRRYGPPTQVDRKYMGNSVRPYESWFYAEIQGGVYFHFVDVRDINNHILVHSTAINEPRNDNWFNEFVDTDTFNSGSGREFIR
jgi:GWxTD domain-containing protein